mgnify:CR=1 FL=1|tara:strand:- start:4402 stop:4620 length:219 start_codon:yes stop_codon:yes gene_type:complete
MSKKEKFKELAENRVKKTLKLLKLIGNLANKTHYDYSAQDSSKIISVLRAEIKNIETRFKSKNSSDENDFKL